MLLGPKFLEALALCNAPAGEARRGGVLGADIDVDPRDFQRSGAVDGQDAAIAGLHLRDDGPAKGE